MPEDVLYLFFRVFQKDVEVVVLEDLLPFYIPEILKTDV
jgi:hypothetical protein